MAETDTKPNLHQRLLEVQKAVTGLTKDGTSKGAGQFAYVSSSLVLGAVREAMDDAGLILTASTVEYTLHLNAAYDAKQHLTELMLELTWVNVDDPTDRESFLFPGQGIDSGEKGVGKAATYAEKYFLLKFFHIATDADDPDAGAPANGKPAQASRPARAQAQAPAQGQAAPLHEDGVCPKCGKPLLRRKRKDGDEFLGCSGYERDGSGCSYTCNIDDEPAQAPEDTPAEPAPPAAAAGQSIQNLGQLRTHLLKQYKVSIQYAQDEIIDAAMEILWQTEAADMELESLAAQHLTEIAAQIKLLDDDGTVDRILAGAEESEGDNE